MYVLEFVTCNECMITSPQRIWETEESCSKFPITTSEVVSYHLKVDFNKSKIYTRNPKIVTKIMKQNYRW